MVMVMVLTRPTPVPYLATSSVAPAPCLARARPCLDVWRGEPSLVQRPLCWPARLWHPWEVPRTGDYGMVL